MTTQPYRQHDEATGPFLSALDRQLGEEWVRLNSDHATRAVITRWARRYPLLAGLTRPRDIVDAIDQADLDTKDALLLTLIQLLQEGQQTAGRIALQAMLPNLRRTINQENRSSRRDDNSSRPIAEFWDVLSNYPVAARPAKVAANLALDTKHRCTRIPDVAAHEVPWDPYELAATDTVHTQTQANPGTTIDTTCTPDDDLPALLHWATARGTLTPGDADLLRSIYIEHPATSPTMRDVTAAYRAHAAATGTSPDALRQRVHRARTRLTHAARAAVHEHTAA